MMCLVRLPMHRDQTVIQLAGVIDVLPDNTWTWSVLDFYGVGMPPAEMTMEQFEVRTRETATGYTFSWPGLRAFSLGLQQTYDCLIVAVANEADIGRQQLDTGRFDRCHVVIEALDSTEWRLSVSRGVKVRDEILVGLERGDSDQH